MYGNTQPTVAPVALASTGMFIQNSTLMYIGLGLIVLSVAMFIYSFSKSK